MKNLFYYLAFIFFLITSCKEKNFENIKKENKTESIKRDIITNKNLTCNEIIRKVIESSDLNLKIYKDYFVRIEEIKNDSINIQVYFKNNLSDNPNEKQIVESTIAWLLFLPNENKLLNVTADPDNPVNLKFKYNDLKLICESCDIKRDTVVRRIDKREDCKDVVLEMGSGRVCILKLTNINNAYLDIIKNEEVEDVKYFLTKLPLKNKTVDVNQNGLMTIDYKIKNENINIIMSYDGGITEVKLEKIDLNVKRSIFYYAD